MKKIEVELFGPIAIGQSQLASPALESGDVDFKLPVVKIDGENVVEAFVETLILCFKTPTGLLCEENLDSFKQHIKGMIG